MRKVIQVTKEAILINNTFSLIVIFCGINDVTHLVRKPVKYVKARFLSIDDTVDHLKQRIDEGLISLRAVTQIPVVFSPLVGLDLAAYSPNNSRACYQQPIIDQSVLQINKYIYSVNSENHVPTPLIESTIHKYKGKTRAIINHYTKLHDGCHPDPQTRAVWASLIFKASRKFLEL